MDTPEMGCEASTTLGPEGECPGGYVSNVSMKETFQTYVSFTYVKEGTLQTFP